MIVHVGNYGCGDEPSRIYRGNEYGSKETNHRWLPSFGPALLSKWWYYLLRSGKVKGRPGWEVKVIIMFWTYYV